MALTSGDLLDISTLVIAHAVLRERSIRGAARALKKPVSSVAGAIDRLESEISVTLIQKAGSDLVLTLEGERLLPHIAVLVGKVEEMMSIGPNNALDVSVSFKALSRFGQVAAAGSIRRAASRIGLGQPQLTRQIAQVEIALGCQLLARGVRGSPTTDKGMRLAREIVSMDEIWTELSQSSARRFRRTAATVRLGSVIPLGYESHIAALLAALIAQWRGVRPQHPLFVSSTTAEELIGGLKSGLFDTALLDTLTVPPDLDAFLVKRTPLAVVGTRGFLDADRKADLAEQLRKAAIALPSPRSGLRQMINRALPEILGENDIEKLRLIEVDSIPVIAHLVLHHGFVSILPILSVASIRGDLAQIPLDTDYALPLWLVWPRQEINRRAAKDVMELLEKIGYASPAIDALSPSEDPAIREGSKFRRIGSP